MVLSQDTTPCVEDKLSDTDPYTVEKAMHINQLLSLYRRSSDHDINYEESLATLSKYTKEEFMYTFLSIMIERREMSLMVRNRLTGRNVI